MFSKLLSQTFFIMDNVENGSAPPGWLIAFQLSSYVHTVPDHFVRRSITVRCKCKQHDIAPISMQSRCPNYMNVKPFCGHLNAQNSNGIYWFVRLILNKCGAKITTIESVYTSCVANPYGALTCAVPIEAFCV